MIDFVFEEKIRQDIDEGRLVVLDENSIDLMKGLALSDNTILINLSASQWKNVTETMLLAELVKTITHENMHLLLKEFESSLETEEKICRIMAEQNEGYV